MHISTIISVLALGAAVVVAAPTDAEPSANLPGLNSIQTNYANAIIAKTKASGFGEYSRKACEAAIATTLVESSLIMYANNAVPASLKYPHDRIGSDHDSIGLFQQRASIYKNIQCDMNAGCSAGQFFGEMKRVRGWETMAVGTLCQKVQRSAYPDRYAKQVPEATNICAAGGL